MRLKSWKRNRKTVAWRKKSERKQETKANIGWWRIETLMIVLKKIWTYLGNAGGAY